MLQRDLDLRTALNLSLGLIIGSLLPTACGCLGTRSGESAVAAPDGLDVSAAAELPPFRSYSSTPPALPLGDLSELGHDSDCT